MTIDFQLPELADFSNEALRVLARDFSKVAKLAGMEAPLSEVKVELLPAPHKIPKLPPQTQAAYLFFLDGYCIKVGKASPGSRMRFQHQHYYEGLVNSNLASSLSISRDLLLALFPESSHQSIQQLGQPTMADWMMTHLSRLHLFIPEAKGRWLLGLLEMFLQCRYTPVFEGPTA